jgi:hypothetical protein
MKKIILVLALIGLTCFSFTSFSYPSARELNEFCVSKDSALNLACATYISGFLSGINAGEYLRSTGKGITVGTFKNVFKKEMKLHPEKGDENPGIVLSQLLLKHHIVK